MRETDFFLLVSWEDFSRGSIGLPGPPMALFLSSQGFEKLAFRRAIVIFLTIYLSSDFCLFSMGGIDNCKYDLWELAIVACIDPGVLAGKFCLRKSG